MGGENIGLLTAFLFGLLSFVSPCVLPIVPGYLSFISGVTFDEMNDTANAKSIRNRILLNSVFFILGFSAVFIALGASASAVGQFLHERLNIISKIAGVLIVVLGIHMTGLFKIPFLNYEKRLHSSAKRLGIFGSFLVGLAFAFGWTPCIGPILAGILTIAAGEGTVGKGILLLTFYSAGLGIPFFLTGMSVSAFYKVFDRFKRHLHKFEIASGALLICIGILIFTNYLTILSGYLSRWFPFLSNLG
ncbi:MAG TPA: cytochrome c biogenesis protein CcdA [Bacteroidota bacterium]|nr:cytochrome c biogenesis protein CcdA [Bacteroidota bacterium]